MKCSVPPAEHLMHSIARHTATTTEEFPMPPVPKPPAVTRHTAFPNAELPALLVTTLRHTRSIHREDPSKKRLEIENGETK